MLNLGHQVNTLLILPLFLASSSTSSSFHFLCLSEKCGLPTNKKTQKIRSEPNTQLTDKNYKLREQ